MVSTGLNRGNKYFWNRRRMSGYAPLTYVPRHFRECGNPRGVLQIFMWIAAFAAMARDGLFPPTRQQIMFNLQMIQHLGDNKIDQIIDALRLKIEARIGWHDGHAHTG